MPRHRLQPLPRGLAGGSSAGHSAMMGDEMWRTLDRVQELGDANHGHRGCVNALSWTGDGTALLSGSDDTRLCIWTPDPSPSESPHPFKLSQVISTGHKDNVFSARFLPNAAVPTIISCAGDRDIRVFDVDRLGRVEEGVVMGRRAAAGDLCGWGGPGVTVLKCHRARTKKLATENSPFIFLSVSEDGTVRQHDLRRPHQCREECPDALFQAPRGINLYSLSVSTVTPNMFAVAGRTDCAFVCDRRMQSHQAEQWGANVKETGQVHCVRRLGLSDDEWNTVPQQRQSISYTGERHITSVKMSPHRADEVICAFAQHSTSLFSILDSPGSSSMRVPSPGVHSSPRQRDRPSPSRATSSSPMSSKRRHSALSLTPDAGRTPPERIRRAGSDDAHQDQQEFAQQAIRDLADDLVAAYRDSQLDDDMSAAEAPTPRPWAPAGPFDLATDAALSPPTLPRGGADTTSWLHDDQRELVHEDMDDDHYIDGFDTADEDMLDEYDLDDDEYDDEYDDDDAIGPSSAPNELASVDLVLPRRCFKGARNYETVKDYSSKVASGSDDGNFFVWDKDTGRLEGIWEGDGSVVNVMEQHPTLPLIATSGIDNTVKIFAPISKPRIVSYARTHMAEGIIGRNLSPSQGFRQASFGHFGVVDFLAAHGIAVNIDDGDDGEEPQPQCATQ